jgi:hypothetical protein
MMAKTTCDWTVERLPWWVNGTLEEAEARGVEVHLAECATCRDELAATRGALALYGAHLPVGALLDLIEDEAAGSECAMNGGELSREAAVAHLGHCAACREELALLRESRAAVAGEPVAEAPERETAGRETQGIETPGALVTPFVPRRAEAPPPVRRRRWADRRGLALAASILLFVVAAGGWLSTARTAERRADLLVELERRYSDAVAARSVDERVAEPPAPGEAPAENVAAAAAAAERAAEQAAEIAALEAEIERLRSAGEGGETVAYAIGAGLAETWDLQPPVMRGDARRIEALPIEVPAGEELLALYLTGLGNRPLTLVVDDAAGDRLLERGGLTDITAPGIDPHRIVTLPLAGLPAGEPLTLRLLADGEVIASRPLRIAR